MKYPFTGANYLRLLAAGEEDPRWYRLKELQRFGYRLRQEYPVTELESWTHLSDGMEPPQMLKSKLTNLFIEDKKTEGKADIRVYLDWMEKFMTRTSRNCAAVMFTASQKKIGTITIDRMAGDEEIIRFMYRGAAALHV